MSDDIHIRIDPSDGQLRFVVTGPALPTDGEEFQREQFTSISPELFDQLRRGSPPPDLVQKVTADVSEWFLSSDLDPLLSSILRSLAEPVRLIISVHRDLRVKLDHIPVELIVQRGASTPLALHSRVASIIHSLPKVGNPRDTLATSTWPFRVLIVRSNPCDLGGAVPPASPIRDNILALGNHLGPNSLQVDILSREDDDGVVGSPTVPELGDLLSSSAYHLLVYLGHGDVQGSPAIGVLQLESSDGTANDPLLADELAVWLHNWPVPVVLLLGCLTSAEVPVGIRDHLELMIPRWMQGSQGVAQRLVNSESGVQLAVGMRYRLESQDAVLFLKAFFESLLCDRPGHVEGAIRVARVHLYPRGQPLSWSAPMVFSTLYREPMFDFLIAPPVEASQSSVTQQVGRDKPSQRLSLTTLRDVLVKLYPTEEDAIQLVVTAGLDLQHITFSEKAINNWTNILIYARNNEQVEDVIRAARDQWSRNSELAAAEQLWLAQSSASAVEQPDASEVPQRLRQVSAQQKMQLVDALLQCQTVSNRQTRDTVVDDLPAEVKHNIQRSANDRVDVVNIVTTALNYSGGLESFIDLVHMYEGSSFGMQEVDRVLAAIG